RDGNSLFAYYFLKALRENQRGVIDIENIFNIGVWKYLVEIGGQRPSVGRLRTPMDEDGQFVFVLSRSERSANEPVPTHVYIDEESNAFRKNEAFLNALVDDCEDGDNFNEFGGIWYSFDDRNKMRGSSKVWPTPASNFVMTSGGANESQYCAGIKGHVFSSAKQGFIGMGCFLNKTKRPVSLMNYNGLIFSFKGTPMKFRLKIHSNSTPDYDDFGYDFQVKPDWNMIRVPFNRMTQEGWGKATYWNRNGEGGAGKTAISLNWQTLEAPKAKIELLIDDIIFY
ncbi:MAG: CIA30 family protein, partial [Thermodesulfobacteriota bacterium]|nr:CIA30 family protein [Thermodesulfobacteriota bacterium]